MSWTNCRRRWIVRIIKLFMVIARTGLRRPLLIKTRSAYISFWKLKSHEFCSFVSSWPLQVFPVANLQMTFPTTPTKSRKLWNRKRPSRKSIHSIINSSDPITRKWPTQQGQSLPCGPYNPENSCQNSPIPSKFFRSKRKKDKSLTHTTKSERRRHRARSSHTFQLLQTWWVKQRCPSNILFAQTNVRCTQHTPSITTSPIPRPPPAQPTNPHKKHPQ